MSTAKLLAMDTPSNLKRTALSGLAWDVYADPLLEVLNVLETAPGVIRTGLAGDHLRAITHQDTQAHDLVSAIRTVSSGRVEIAQVEPTLEDVFLALASQ